MLTDKFQRLVSWEPSAEIRGKRTFFQEVAIVSLCHPELTVSLVSSEGRLVLSFAEVRTFMTTWVEDEGIYLTKEEAFDRPSELCKVEDSRWLAYNQLDLKNGPSSQDSEQVWEHFYIRSDERSLHVAARGDIRVTWLQE